MRESEKWVMKYDETNRRSDIATSNTECEGRKMCLRIVSSNQSDKAGIDKDRLQTEEGLLASGSDYGVSVYFTRSTTA